VKICCLFGKRWFHRWHYIEYRDTDWPPLISARICRRCGLREDYSLPKAPKPPAPPLRVPTDRERLDWLERNRSRIRSIEGPDGFPENMWRIWGDVEDPTFTGGFGPTIRAAIDHAILRDLLSGERQQEVGRG